MFYGKKKNKTLFLGKWRHFVLTGFMPLYLF